MVCSKCGANFNENTRFCPQCGAAVSQAPTQPEQPPKSKSSKKKWIMLASVAVVAVAAGVLLMLLLGGGNDYQRIYKALLNTVRMESADVYFNDYKTASFCIDSDSSDLQYYFEYDSDVYGLYGGNMFRYRNNRGSKFPASSVLLSRNETNLELFLIAALCSGRLTDKDFLHPYFEVMNDMSGVLEKSREAIDIANVRSAYAEVVTRYLENPSKMPQEITVKAEQTVEDWQTDPMPSLIYQSNWKQETYYFPASVRGYIVGIELLSDGNARPRITEAVNLEKNTSSLEIENDFGAALDILFDKLSDEEWMNQSCSITKSEDGEEDVYNLTIRPKRFLSNALKEIKAYLHEETAENLVENINWMVGSDPIKLQVTIADGKITRVKSAQREFEANLEYYKGKLSEIQIVYNGYRTIEISFDNVDAIKFDKAYMEDILAVCEEKELD